MLQDWVPVLIFLILVTAFGVVSLFMSWLLGVRKPSQRKLSPYECGVTPIGTARERVSVKFYLVAVLFILFDIEAVFLYPWAVSFRQLGLYGLIEMSLFILILFVGYVYLLKKRALEWES